MIPWFIFISKYLTALSLEVTNKPGMAMVLGLNLARTCFFVKW